MTRARKRRERKGTEGRRRRQRIREAAKRHDAAAADPGRLKTKKQARKFSKESGYRVERTAFGWMAYSKGRR